jgi:hypothetical protein
MNKRTVVLPDSNTHVTFTAENIADAMKTASATRARGNEWQARNAESYATMVATTIGVVFHQRVRRNHETKHKTTHIALLIFVASCATIIAT